MPSLIFFFFLLSLSLLLLLFFVLSPRPVSIPIKGRHVFISGGSSGIGLAIARRAAAEGARVSILARSAQKLEEARVSIRLATGVDVSVFSADVMDFDGVRRALDAAGPVDVLVCNHGVFFAQELEMLDIGTVKSMIDVNLMGTFHLIKAALPAMKARARRGPGSIAIMSSQSGQVGIYGYTAYAASKFGLHGLGEALQQELIAENIHVSLICPPETETPGLIEADKMKPKLTSIISKPSAVMKADAVAVKTLDGIKSGSFIVSCTFGGYLLSIASASFAPQRSYLIALLEVLLAGLARLIGLVFLWKWYRTIEKWHAQNRSKLLTN